MWKLVSGYCPVHDEEREIEVKYSSINSIGSQPTEKPTEYKCSVHDLSHKECGRCPIFSNCYKVAP